MPGPDTFGILNRMRTLAIRPGAIGDLILSLPALEYLKSGYLEVWTSGANVPLIRFAQRVRSVASTGIDLLGLAEPPPKLLPDLRQFDRIVSWYGASRPDFVELTRSLGLPFEFHRALPPEGDGRHAVDFYLEQVRATARDGISGDRIPRISNEVQSTLAAALAAPFGDWLADHLSAGVPLMRVLARREAVLSPYPIS